MPSEHPNAAQSKRRRGRPPIARDYYGSVMTTTEAITLRYAADIEGLDKEIDVLRTKLRGLVDKDRKERENLPLLFRGIDILARLVAVRYRLSKKAQADLASSIAAVIQRVGDQFFPEGRGGA